MSADGLDDRIIWRGAVMAIGDMLRYDDSHPLYGAYLAAAIAWTNEAQGRLEGAMAKYEGKQKGQV